MPHDVAYVLGIVAIALIFDFINGFHDSANSIATVVSTRVLSPGVAVVWAAVFKSWPTRSLAALRVRPRSWERPCNERGAEACPSPSVGRASPGITGEWPRTRRSGDGGVGVGWPQVDWGRGAAVVSRLTGDVSGSR